MRPACFFALSALSVLFIPAASAAVTPAEQLPEEAATSASPPGSERGTGATANETVPDTASSTPEAGASSADAANPDTGEAPDSGEENEPPQLLPGEFTAEVALVSDYIYRGITNTDHNPAIQGGVTYSVDVGLPMQPYIGFWGSNVDFDDGGEASVEIDALFGLSGTVSGLDWDLGGQYYAYPGARSDLNYNYWEIPLQLSYPLDEHVTILGHYAYSPDFFAASGNAHYLLGGARWEHPIFSTTLTLEATTGHQWIEDNDAYGAKDYQDWRIAASVTVDKITLGIAYTDTSLSKGECFSGTNQCGPRVTFSLGASF